MNPSATELLRTLTGWDTDDDVYDEEFDEFDDANVDTNIVSPPILTVPRRNNPVKRIRHNGCSICFDQEQDLTDGTSLLILGCSHRICSVCFSDYVRHHLNHTNVVFHTRGSIHRDTDYSLTLKINELIGVPCPCNNCNHVISNEEIQKYTDIITFRKFSQFAFDNYVSIIRPTLPPCKRCGYILQEDCLCVNADCRKLELKQRALEQHAKQFVLPGVKCCPKCFFEIEKNGGCDHMICIKCNSNFLWSEAPIYGKNANWFMDQHKKLSTNSKVRK